MTMEQTELGPRGKALAAGGPSSCRARIGVSRSLSISSMEILSLRPAASVSRRVMSPGDPARAAVPARTLPASRLIGGYGNADGL